MPPRPDPPAHDADERLATSEGLARSAPLRISLLYAAGAAAWILLSDKVLLAWLDDPGQFVLASAVKGWFFVAMTAALLYLLLVRRWHPDASALPAGPRRALLGRLLVFVLLVVAGSAAAVTYSLDRLKTIELQRLAAVAELKVGQLTTWLDERSRSARLVESGANATNEYRRWREEGRLASREGLLRQLQQMRSQSGFDAISLLDEQGRILWHSEAIDLTGLAQASAPLQAIALQREVRHLGPYRDAAGEMRTDIVLPLQWPGTRAAPLLVFHLRGEQYLPAKLRDWPIPTRSGEVVLVRRDGDEVVFLNRLSQAPDAALRLRQPLDSEQLLAAQLVRSGALTTVTLDGTDYKGVQAFGAGRNVPGSDWFLLAKTDHAEIYAAAVEEAGWIVLSTTLAILMAMLFFRMARQRQALTESVRTQAVQRERLQALQLLSAVSNSSEDAIYAKDLDGRYTLFNEAASRFVGKPVGEVIGRDDLALFPPEQAAALRQSGQQAIASGHPLSEEHALQTAQGPRIFLSTRGPLHDAAGTLIGEFGISRDITESKRAESALRRVNRMLLTSHGCSQALMRASSVDELLQSVCETIVHTGGYRLAWVGMADAGDERRVRPVAQAGFEDGYLESVHITWADEPDGHGPTGTAVRERRPVTSRKLIDDPSYAPWREAALQRGYAASIALPLLPGDGDCLGALNLYAAEPEAFDEDEVRSAVELANDLAFGIRALRDREARLAEEARYRALFAANPQPMWVHDLDSLAFLEVNAAAVERYGYSRDEFLSMRITDIQSPQAQPALSDEAMQPGVVGHRLKDGRVIQASISSHRIAYLSRQAMLVLAVDVTAQLTAEAALKVQARRAEALLSLPGLAEQGNEADFMQQAQELAEDLTGSRIAFIHFINPDGESIELVTWSRRTLAHFCRAAHDRHYPVSEAGIWADALRERKPVIFNDYAAYPHKRGLPEGHAQLDRLISVPVIEDGRVVMLTGVGGKATDYDALDVETVQLISNDIWRLVQRRRSSAALLESETSYRNLTERVPAIIYRAELDERGTTTYVSPAIETLGYSPAEWLAQPSIWSDSLHPEDRDRVLQALALARREQLPIDQAYRLRTRSGEWRHLQDKADLVRDEAGRPRYLQGLMVDISQQVRTEAELRKLFQAVEQSPNSIVVTNLQAEIEYVNEAFLHTTGYRREEVIGQNPRILQAAGGASSDHAGMWAALTQGQPWKGEFRNRRKDGSTYVEFAHVAPLRQPDGSISHYVAVKEDITEKKRIGHELDRYRAHLEELVTERTTELAEARQRAEAANEAKSAFLANMSHEIRTPMNAIVGLTHLLQGEDMTPRQAHRLGQIRDSAHHLLAIITGILDLTKIEAGKVTLDETDFHISALLDHVHGLVVDRALAKGVQMMVERSGVPPWLHGDLTRLRQALLNYADNAVKFTPQGSIRLRVRVIEDKGEQLLLRFEVQDTGIGIAADKLPRLFQAFEQADTSTTRRYGGTGLGLAVARRLAGLMGGEAGADSEPGVGSSFWFTARLRRGHPVPAEVGPDSLPGTAEAALREQCAGARVLLAEDDEINREVAIALLNAAGLMVDTAVDGRDALALVERHPYDLVLMDVQMPIMDGFEATRAIRAQPALASLPILAMTANIFEEDRRACMDAGMDDFVPKPVEPALLYATLLRWLPRRGLRTAQSLPATPAPIREADAAQIAASVGLDAIEGLRPTQALQALRGDVARYLDLLKQLRTTHAADPQRIADAWAGGETDAARQRAHALKGAAATLGANAVQEAAAELETALRVPVDRARVEQLMLALRQRAEALFDGLAALNPVPGRTEAVRADQVQAQQVLAELEPLIARDDTAACERYEAARALLTATLGAEAITLGRHLEAFDFPTALACLHRLRATPA